MLYAVKNSLAKIKSRWETHVPSIRNGAKKEATKHQVTDDHAGTQLVLL